MYKPQESDLTSNSFLIPRSRVLCDLIKLKPGVFPKNFYANVIHNFILGFLLSAVELLQKYLLTDPHYYNLSPSEVFHTTVILTTVDLGSRLIFFTAYGILLDRIGRKKMAIGAYINISIALACFPLHSCAPFFANIFPWLYIARVLYASGTSMLIVMPFVGDYVENDSKGRALSINTAALSSGLVLAVLMCKLLYPKPFSVFFMFMLTLGVSLIPGLVYSFCLKKNTILYQVSLKQLTPSQSASKKNKTTPLHLIFRTIKRRPWISAGFIFSFLGGMNLGLVGQALHPLIVCGSLPSLDDNYENIQRYSFLAAVLFTFIIQLLLDCLHVVYIIYLVLFIGLGSYGCIYFIKDPEGIWIFILTMMCFISCLGYVAIVNYLDFRFCPRVVRGHSYGLKLMVLALGMLSTAVPSGLIQNSSAKMILLYLLFGSTLIGMLIFLIIYFKTIRPWENSTDRNRGTGIKTLLSIEGMDHDLFENSQLARGLLDEYKHGGSHIRQYGESLISNLVVSRSHVEEKK